MNRRRTIRRLAVTTTALFLLFHISHSAAAGNAWNLNPAPRIDLAAKGMLNANHTGVLNEKGTYSRAVSNQKVHSDFGLNSNSCASCHMTHTAAGGGQLFQQSVYNTCSTCHFDDSMNTYNVLSSSQLPGGRFFDPAFKMDARQGQSYHLATGFKKLGDAPGADLQSAGEWQDPLTCGSCHAPHGSYGERQLNLNPNGQAKRYNGIRLVLTDTGSQRYQPQQHQDKTPWLFCDEDSLSFERHGLLIHNAAGENVTKAFFVHYEKGYVEKREAAGPAPYMISFSQAMTVGIEFTKTDGREETIYRYGTTDFCTACHTGYAVDANGGITTKHRNFTHTINTDLSDSPVNPDARLKLERSKNAAEERLVCLTCHYAHGTDTALMIDRNFKPMYTDNQDDVPAATRLLRFGYSEDGWEACIICHEAGGPTAAEAQEEVVGQKPAAGEETAAQPDPADKPAEQQAGGQEPSGTAPLTEDIPAPASVDKKEDEVLLDYQENEEIPQM